MPQRLPLWLTVLVLSRDIVIVATVTVVNLAVSRRTFKPSLLGKCATAVFVATGLMALYANYLGVRLAVVDLFVYASLFITLASSIHYVFLIFRSISHEPEPAAKP
jgi:cardiolipin synthase